MKRVMAACLGVLCLLTACVPTEKTELKGSPDFAKESKLTLNMDQLHNDALDLFDNPEIYVFIEDVSIGGDDEKKQIVITAQAVSEAAKEDAEHFAAAVIRHVNDAAAEQSSLVRRSSSEDFGGLWETYDLQLTVTQGSEGKKLLELAVKHGEKIGLDPDVESYEESWEEEAERYDRYHVYKM